MKLTNKDLRRIIKEELNYVLNEGEVPQEAKEKLFDKLVAKGYADPEMGHSADDVLADEVEKDSEDYKKFKKAGLLVKVGDKFYVGEY